MSKSDKATTIIAAVITGACTLIAGFYGGRASIGPENYKHKYEELLSQYQNMLIEKEDLSAKYQLELDDDKLYVQLKTKYDALEKQYQDLKVENENLKNKKTDSPPTTQTPNPASIKLENITNIGAKLHKGDAYKDNYENEYAMCYFLNGRSTFHTLLNMKYSKFKGTAYIGLGEQARWSTKIIIEADGSIIYSSPEITKTSRPIELNINITDCNEFKITLEDSSVLDCPTVYFADCGFYQ
ncbi:MAG: NPCBM/NEW2 domain-containing protein [Clostridiales bacterium]|nr:NPCBM/NEW2 domain-containing protein [Clostridiales bacterium]